MPELDLTGQIAERATEMVRAILKDLGDKVFAGPDGERYSREEALQRLYNMTPEERQQEIARVGLDQYIKQGQQLTHGDI